MSLLFISLINVIINAERYAFILILIFLLKCFIEKLNLYKIIILAFLAIFMMTFILEPLKRGSFESQYSYDLTAIVFHLQPLYIASIESFRLSNSISDLLIESLPLLKSFFQNISVVDKIGYNVLPNYLYSIGNRLEVTFLCFLILME